MMAGQRVALVVPTLNEGGSIVGALSHVPRNIIDRILVADGGSQDETADRARAAGAEVLHVGRGYGRACYEGAQKVADDCDIIAFMDGDGADRVDTVKDLVGPIARGEQDFVLGSRTRGEREPGSMGPHQLLAGRVVGWVIALSTGVAYSDMSAFRAIRRDALLALGMREMTFGWNVEMQVRAARQGLRVLEVPVPYSNRLGGRSKVAGSLKGTIKATVNIGSTLVRVLREPARPGSVSWSVGSVKESTRSAHKS
jgi:glycosyltransferase involved in cell wall biosynthesis